MITNTSKNNSFMCSEDLCVDQTKNCQMAANVVEQQSSIKKYLRELWLNLRLFAGTDRWGRDITLKAGDAHYTMRMDEVESRWRTKQS